MTSLTRRDVLALGALYVIWGSTFFAIRYAVAGFPPLLMAGTRYLVAGSGLYAWARVRGAPGPTLRQWGGSAVSAFLVLVLGNGLVAIAEQSVPSSLCALIFASQPLWATLAGGLLGERPSRRVWLGLALGAFGVAVLQRDAGSLAHPAMAGLVLIGAIAMGSGSAVMRRLPLPSGGMRTAAQLLAGGGMLLATGFGASERIVAAPPASALLALLFLIVFGSLVGYRAFAYVSTRLPPALATSYAFVNPLVAAVLGAGLGGEHLGPAAALGLALILGALAVIASRPSRSVAPLRASGPAGSRG